MDLQNFLESAKGKLKADLLVLNGNIVNVYTGEIQREYSIAVKGERIVYIGREPDNFIGSDTTVIDAYGKTVIPGFIDGHTHLLWCYRLDEFLKYSMKGGTTCIISESLELVFPLGEKGIHESIKISKNQPVKIFFTVPSMVSMSPVSKKYAIDAKCLKKFLKKKEILGLGESYWFQAYDGDESLLDLYKETLCANKLIEGHTSGAKGQKLGVLAGLGISSCHEPITEEEVLERLRLGLFVFIREGSIRRELEAVSGLKDRKLDFRRLALASDGLFPEDLINFGHMDYIVQKAIDLGFDPVAAVQMATINAAERFGIDKDIGGLSPGKYADMVILPDIKKIVPEYVISNGKVIAENGKLLVLPRKFIHSEFARNSIKLSKFFKPADFEITTDRNGPVKVRVIDLVTSLVTKELQMDLKPTGGLVLTDISRDILKIVAIERTYTNGKKCIGFIKGFGLKSGALACSDSWDTTDILAVGTNDDDIALVVNRIIELKGGIVLGTDGKILAEVPLSIAGMLFDGPLDVLAEKLQNLQEKAEGLGCDLLDAHLTLGTLSTPAIPSLRICESGLFDVKKGKMMDLIIK
ncbi:MAG: adenine deaminase C-terminal domain-containing protein [Thermodesulfobacteriota bacterium]|nr:adenine deaminase C-terminal domain-containing protein [Thermodesulfobacteriota bacterium]